MRETVSGIQKGRTGTDGGDKGLAFEEEMGRGRSAKLGLCIFHLQSKRGIMDKFHALINTG